MKHSIKIVFLIALIALVSSCKKTIESLQKDPNNPASVPPDQILGSILKDISGLGNSGSLMGINSWDQVPKYNQYYLAAYSYYGTNQYKWQSGASFDSYQTLKNEVQMEKEAAIRDSGTVRTYKAIGRFAKAWYFYNLTSLMGDIPLNDALKGLPNMQPAYTAQKDVFKYVLSVLDSANTDFTILIANGDNTLSSSNQDIYYNSNLSLWQKAVNTLKLRVLIGLSNKASDADLNVSAQFAAIINNPGKYPIFQSQAEDLKFIYIPTYNQYAINKDNFGSTASRYAMSKTYVKSLTDLNDARVFITCEPAWSIVDSLKKADSAKLVNMGVTDPYKYSAVNFNAYVGESTGASMDLIQNEVNSNAISFINRKRYYSTYVGEPNVLLGYKEMCFNIAEAINRGWVSGDAEAWYKQGIFESMSFYGITPGQTSYNAYFLKSGDLTNIAAFPFTFDLNSYYNQSSVKYVSGPQGLSQILMQKYIAMFQNSAWEAYFNYRRTGVPAFEGGPGIGNNSTIPLRWAYPVSEQNQNGSHWKSALASQGFSTDDINAKMWLMK